MWALICEWLSSNALAIIISGIVSLVVSKYYFDKANRESVITTIIFPIVKILDSRYYTKSNYEALFKINSSYASKYLKRNEKINYLRFCHLTEMFVDILKSQLIQIV